MRQIIEQGRVPIKAWVDGVELEPAALDQVRNVASLPVVGPHVALMPDVHWGIGATVGSVIPTRGGVIPAAVGVDIGCGVIAERLGLVASDLPNSLAGVRAALEAAIPHGGPGVKGSWREKGYDPPKEVDRAFMPMWRELDGMVKRHDQLEKASCHAVSQMGTLGTGNHFIEVCLDEADRVWLMLHSGSRGIGNAIGTYFIERARDLMQERGVNLPDRDLAWLPDDTEAFREYIAAMRWAQGYALANRVTMMTLAKRALFAAVVRDAPPTRETDVAAQRWASTYEAINTHHNFTQLETHFGKEVWLTRKGAVSARLDQLGIIPGSMGARSYIVRGLGNPESFESCSHGAGRRMSRGAAKRAITLEQHAEATRGVECRKDAGVLNESPAAYKSIDAVMAAQADLVEVVHELRQVVNVKG
jgi:tRNA-splicing ligase RtcB